MRIVAVIRPTAVSDQILTHPLMPSHAPAHRSGPRGGRDGPRPGCWSTRRGADPSRGRSPDNPDDAPGAVAPAPPTAHRPLARRQNPESASVTAIEFPIPNGAWPSRSDQASALEGKVALDDSLRGGIRSGVDNDHAPRPELVQRVRSNLQ